MRRSLEAILCVVFLAAAQSAQCENALDLLKKAGRGPDTVSFMGTKTATFNYCGRQVTSTARVFHKAPSKTRVQFLSPKQLAGVIMIENGEQAWEFVPRHGMWRSIGAIPMLQQERVDSKLLATHILDFTGTEKKAGRVANVLHIRQKLDSQPTRRLWIDKQYSVVIASAVADSGGRLVSSSHYSNITFFPKDIDIVEFAPKGQVSGCSDRCGNCKLPVVPKYVPQGYKRINVGGVLVSGHDCTVVHYTNGISSFTIFQRDSAKQRNMKFMKNGVTNALVWSSGERVYTLLGDLPQSEIRRIAESIDK
jgi:negative regulator of sigma E activity